MDDAMYIQRMISSSSYLVMHSKYMNTHGFNSLSVIDKLSLTTTGESDFFEVLFSFVRASPKKLEIGKENKSCGSSL